MPNSDLKDLSDLLKNFIEMGAIIVGGFWTYFNFFKGRTYKLRVECAIAGSAERLSGRPYVRAIAQAKNVGLSAVPIDQKGTILQFYAADAHHRIPASAISATWETQPAVFDVFTQHKRIEPGESIEDPILIELPTELAAAYKLTLKISSGKVMWTANAIVEVSATETSEREKNDNQVRR